MTSRRVTAKTLKDWLTDGQEIALLDVREEGPFGRGHMFLAVNLPLSRLELSVGRLVPRQSTRIVLCDEGDGLSERASEILAASGYRQTWMLDGGIKGWRAQGYGVFSGTYVLEHAFGHFITSRYGTPRLTAGDLMAKLEGGEAPVIIDTRPFEDFQKATIPGSINVPLGEIASRYREVVPDKTTEIVVHCAGLTRGALGAQTLINCSLENPISVLLDGTKGWEVAGGELEQRAARRAPPPSDVSLARLAQIRRRMAERFQIPLVSEHETTRRNDAAGKRTFILIDIRSREEFEEGHLAGSVWIPGGELIGMTQDHLATRNAHLCLVDDGKGRAEIIASWLILQGWPNVAVLDGGTGQGPLVTGPPEAVAMTPILPKVPTMDTATLADRIEAGDVTVVDFASSLDYRSGHIPGAWWMTRSSLPQQVYRLPHADSYVTTSTDGRVGQLAAAELASLVQTPVIALHGGTAAWRAAGFSLAVGMQRPLGEVGDIYWDFAECPDDGPKALMAKRRRIIAWRSRLKDHYERDATMPFVEPRDLEKKTSRDIDTGK